ncbi:autoinducer-2 kinase [Fusibacter ferrireducens]|uniref:Autoinducer-2 kinase n=1 Tax=Fusibacter ferrireducens TaxID=2785058 RepID=A0ABR9ZS89_9FIRM|nr:autoinducer-2 kinase [Fusibacter ferrireducens]MBF4693317.1 autoinducer-2 kinase [Fusibacter ferrireducens]
MKQYIMAIDAGTGSVRTVIFDQNFNQISVAQKEWTHKEDPQYEGAIDFDVTHNTKLLFDTIREALKTAGLKGDEIAAISTTSMREAFVLYNRAGEEIWAVSNVDSRASKEVYELKALSDTIEDEVYKASGQTFALGAIPRLLWVKNNLPEIYEETASITMLNDWIIYKLTGILSVEPSNASTTGILNTHTRQWDSKIIEKCGLKETMYPPVYESGTVVGTITEAIATSTGLNPECKVVVGGGDVQMGCIGLGITSPNQAALLGGSFWQLEYNTDSPHIDEKGLIRVNCHATPDMWQQELIAFYPGLVMRWFRDVFCDFEVQQAKDTGQNVYDILNEKAKAVPVGSHGIMCSFSSVMDYKNWQHPSPCFTNFGIDPEKYNKAAFYRSLLENAALVTLGHKKIIEDLFGHFPETITFASGASNSALWCQIVADVLGVTVQVPVIKESTALGAAFCAAVGIGWLKSLEHTQEHVTIEHTFTPNNENHTKYQMIFNNWKALSIAQQKSSSMGFLSHMWRAPGI